MTNKQVGGIKVKRLFWDIEVAPNLVFAWGIGHKISVNHEAIVKERKIICIAYKWEGESKVTVLRWDNNQDDRSMLRKFLAVANEADELVAHYGDHFDMPWFRARCLILGFEPLPPYKTIDTKAWASKYYFFNSNKLDYLAKVFGFGGKLKTDYQLWVDIVLKKSKTALDYMCKYCGIDVDRLEQVFHKLKFCTGAKTHMGVVNGLEKWTSPRDGSTDVIVSKRRITSSGNVTWQMQSKVDGSYYTISETAYKQFLAFKKKKNGKK